MDECNMNDESHYQDTDSYAITFKDVEEFFRDYNECQVSIIYLNRYNDGVFADKVRVTDIDDCKLFFSYRQNYYFCYMNLISNVIGWSKHPKSLGLQGYIGNHISIGKNEKNKLDIHETVYETMKSVQGNHSIIYKKHHTSITHNENQLANVLLNDIKCFKNKSLINIKGGYIKQIVKGKTKTFMKTCNIVSIFEKRYRKIKHEIEKNDVVFIRIQFINIKDSEKFIRQCMSLCDENVETIHLISDSQSKTSVIILNL